MEAWQLLAHRHWFTVSAFGRELRLCARCSGYTLGLLTALVIRGSLLLPVFQEFAVPIQLIACFVLALPLAIDWITQNWGWRESNNGLRFSTGAVFGFGVALFSSIAVAPDMKMYLYLATAALIVLVGFLEAIPKKI